MVKTSIVNVVAVASLNQKLNLHLLEVFKEIVYDERKYHGKVAYFKLPGMQGKVSIFSSGKMISIGTKSEKEASDELTLARDFLVHKRITSSLELKPKTQNIVAVVKFEQKVDLEEMAAVTKMIYEPEQFPGGILRLEEPHKATVLIFASGKAVVTGLSSSRHIEPIVQKLSSLLRDYPI